MKITKFTDLITWQKGHQLVLTEDFSRQSSKEKIQFYYTAKASLTELQNQLLIAKDVKYIPQSKFTRIAQQTIEVHKLINGLIKKLK